MMQVEWASKKVLFISDNLSGVRSSGPSYSSRVRNTILVCYSSPLSKPGGAEAYKNMLGKKKTTKQQTKPNFQTAKDLCLSEVLLMDNFHHTQTNFPPLSINGEISLLHPYFILLFHTLFSSYYTFLFLKTSLFYEGLYKEASTVVSWSIWGRYKNPGNSTVTRTQN